MLLEILIDPTASIIFQRIKSTKDIMKEQSRNIKESIINLKTVFINISKGFLIFLVVFITYFVLVNKIQDTSLAITITDSTLVLSIMLITYQLKGNAFTLKTFVNSFKDKVSLLVNLGVIIGLISLIYIPVFNKMANTITLEPKCWLLIIILVLTSILPFYIFKIRKKINVERNKLLYEENILIILVCGFICLGLTGCTVSKNGFKIGKMNMGNYQIIKSFNIEEY